MRKSKFSERQIIKALKDNETGRKAADVARDLSISVATFYGWRKKYGGIEASEVKRLEELEAENAKLKAMYAESQLDNKALKDARSGNVVASSARRQLASYFHEAHARPITRACALESLSRASW